jgi:hypothetical protein
MSTKSLRTLIFIWLGWFIVLFGFQWLVTTRLQVERPDRAVFWSATETNKNSNKGKIYLLEPFLNRQVAWDSEYYVGITVAGYNDPAAGVAYPADRQPHIKNYSFFPFYPYLMKAFMFPLKLLGMDPIATASLAGVIVSLLGTLAGMIALYDMTRDHLEEEGALRAVFYMLIFPTAFFFAQVYTEGLFIGLAFGCLALSRRRQWVWASLLAVLAAWTRAHGAALALPLGIAWLRMIDWKKPVLRQLSWKRFVQAVCVFLPVVAYLVWRYSPLGQGWAALQPGFFGRGLLPIEQSIKSWAYSLDYAKQFPEAGIYMGIEIGAISIALVSALALLRKYPEIAWFSLAVIVLSVFSGSAQSIARYVLVAPAMYVLLGRLGGNKTFDRVWTIASLLLMGMEVMLFSFDMWVG